METKKIFIADDDPDILHILTLILRTRNFNVRTSTDANDIFELDEFIPDLILLDIWMSGIDGREIFTRIKANQQLKNIPVIFISANSHLAEIATEMGADGFIAKPFEMQFILSSIQQIFNNQTSDQT